MAIHPLPPSTTRLLNSTQVLTTPLALVKELIDNGLDARATSIDIIISNNTVDKIEVRDNGHGIAPDDRHVLGLRGHTSKLQKFEDLQTVGCASLGFRGGALASATELGEVTITTRTEGEAVATAIRLKVLGGIDSASCVSQPVGTTVTVKNTFLKIPVRRQTVVKESKKILSKMKEMLKSYALARLNVRFTLKVLEAPKFNCSLVPRPKDSIKEVVSLVIGHDTASQCEGKTCIWIIGGTNSGTIKDIAADLDKSLVARDSRTFIVEAYLPRSDADFSKVAQGHFVSVDSRPVSCARGTLKKLVSSYKASIRSSASSDITEMPSNPFIRLNIICPPGSYDPNIEPLKDDVIFECEDNLLVSAETWFQSLYGPQKEPIKSPLVTLETLQAELVPKQKKYIGFKAINFPAAASSGEDCRMSDANTTEVIDNEQTYPEKWHFKQPFSPPILDTSRLDFQRTPPPSARRQTILHLSGDDEEEVMVDSTPVAHEHRSLPRRSGDSIKTTLQQTVFGPLNLTPLSTGFHRSMDVVSGPIICPQLRNQSVLEPLALSPSPRPQQSRTHKSSETLKPFYQQKTIVQSGQTGPPPVLENPNKTFSMKSTPLPKLRRRTSMLPLETTPEPLHDLVHLVRVSNYDFFRCSSREIEYPTGLADWWRAW